MRWDIISLYFASPPLSPGGHASAFAIGSGVPPRPARSRSPATVPCARTPATGRTSVGAAHDDLRRRRDDCHRQGYVPGMWFLNSTLRQGSFRGASPTASATRLMLTRASQWSRSNIATGMTGSSSSAALPGNLSPASSSRPRRAAWTTGARSGRRRGRCGPHRVERGSLENVKGRQAGTCPA
jgi:hypothetical protein